MPDALPTTMRAIVADGSGGLELVERPLPEPGAGEVLVGDGGADEGAVEADGGERDAVAGRRAGEDGLRVTVPERAQAGEVGAGDAELLR